MSPFPRIQPGIQAPLAVDIVSSICTQQGQGDFKESQGRAGRCQQSLWANRYEALPPLQTFSSANSTVPFHLSVVNGYLWIFSTGLKKINMYLMIHILEHWPKSMNHGNTQVPDCTEFKTPALLLPSTPLKLQLLTLTHPVHIKVWFLFAPRCTLNLRGWRNLMPPLMSKHHPIHQRDISLLISSEGHVWSSCFQSIPIRSCFTMSVIFLKTGKELYLLSAWIKLVHALRRLMTHVQVPSLSETIRI